MTLSSSVLELASWAASVFPATRRSRLLVLIYHRVRCEPDSMFPDEVTAVEFDWQMNLLARFMYPLPLLQAVELLGEGRLPPRAVAVTFDDGYADNYEVALPILRKQSVPATFFVASGFLDGGVMWNDAVIESLRGAQSGNIDLREFGLEEARLGEMRQRGDLANSVISKIKHAMPDRRAEFVDLICRRTSTALPRQLMMTSNQVRELHESGMEVGAHTVSHPILCTLSAADVESEVAGSRKKLEAIIGAPVRSFAYPNGKLGQDFTMKERNIVADLGFSAAFSTTPSVALPTSDRFLLPRLTPWGKHPAQWFGRLLRAYGTVPTLRPER